MFRGVSPQVNPKKGKDQDGSQKENETLRREIVDEKKRQHTSTVFVISNDAEEFDVERRVLWQDVLPELQNFAFQSNFDLEWCDVPLESGSLTSTTVEHVLQKWKENENNLIVCLLGNRYGSVSAPSSLRKEEFESIRSSLFELNVDVRIIDQCYQIDRSRSAEEYRLIPSVITDSKLRSKLTKTIQKGAQAAHEEGTINQVHEQRQNRFFISPLESLVRSILQTSPNRCICLMRRIEGAKVDEKNNKAFLEKTEGNIRKIEDLKNDVTLKMNDRVMTHLLRPENSDITYYFNSRDSDKYRDKISRQFHERLKTQLAETHRHIRPGPPVSPLEMAANEDDIHTEYVKRQLAHGNLPRSTLEKRLDEVANIKTVRGVFLIQGPDVCGKTQALCRLYSKIPDKNVYKIIRFVNLSYSSNFAHEVWRNICITLCMMANIDPSQIVEQFKLAKILECLELCAGLLDKPVCIFIDDVHHLKCGHFLSAIEKRVQSAPDKLSLYMTSSNVSPVHSMFTITQTINIDVISEDEMVEMLKQYAEKAERKLNGEQLGAIKNEMVSSGNNILVAKCYAHEILQNGASPSVGGIDGRLERIENDFGREAVRTICKFLCVSSHGLTRLELHDVMTLHKELLVEISSQTFPMLLLDNVIEALGPLVRKVFMDYREVISFAHLTLCTIIRHRYLSTTSDLKSTHTALSDLFSELYIDIDNMSPRHSISYQKSKKTSEESSKRSCDDLLQLWQPPAEKKSKKEKTDIVAVLREWTDSINSVRNKTEKLTEAHRDHHHVSLSNGRGIGMLIEANKTLTGKVNAVEEKIEDLGKLITAFLPPPPPSAPSMTSMEGEEKVDSETALAPISVGPWDVEMENSSPSPPPPRANRPIVRPPPGTRSLLAHPQAEEQKIGFLARKETTTTSTNKLDGFYRIPKKPAAPKVKESFKSTRPMLKATKDVCLFCGENHRSQECNIYTTALARMNTLKMRKLCPSCGLHEFDGTCPYAPPVCGNCRGRHQTALCGKTYR